jgi:hypothetical protein
VTGTVRAVAGWRDRRFAPLYALVLAFALAWGLGAAFTPHTAQSEPARTTIRFVTGQATPVRELNGSRVEVYPLAGGPLTAGQIRDSALTIGTPDQDYLICVRLGSGWAPAQEALRQGADTCWRTRAGLPGVTIELVKDKE